MKCPSCKVSQLAPAEIEVGLVGAECPQCSGVLLPLINYRYWQGVQAPKLDNDNIDQKVEALDTKDAKLCPKCSRIMIKYRVGVSTDNMVELCGHCDEAWLDAGEWQLLKSLDLAKKLPELFTQQYQRNLRAEKEEASIEEYFKNTLGADAYQKVSDFRLWLQAHPNRTVILHYLTNNALEN